ncbi:MAG: class I SAM-dependent methyltransferase [bacterium]|nr:class I SAM-dependent methyltransferase [bacterium]
MNCPKCKYTKDLKIIIDNLKSDYNQGDPTLYQYIHCLGCNLVSIYPQPDLDKLNEEVYNEKYFYYPDLKWYQKIIYKLYLYKEYDRWIIDDSNQKSSSKKILDLGCGQGEFLDKMKNNNWQVYGMEINPFLVKKLKEKFSDSNIYILDQFLNDKISQKFDIITFWHVIEHLTTPLDTLLKAKNLLNKKGELFIEVPNVDSFVFSLFKQKYTWLRIPDHVYYYSPKSLQKLLEESGYKNVKITSPIKSNLNFSLNLYNAVSNKKMAKVLLVLSIPVSIIISIIASLLFRGEIIRASCSK